MANPSAVIIIPSTYLHAPFFEASAKALKAQVYRGDAEIVKVVLDSSEHAVCISTSTGDPFPWGTTEDLLSVVTISHGGLKDGPVLFENGPHHQPWSSDTDNDWTSYGFTREGLQFWTTVKLSLAGSDPWKPLKPKDKRPKIILFGCLMGSSMFCDSYAQKVAWATGAATWGVTDTDGAPALCAPADSKTVVDVVRGIEKGTVGSFFKRFKQFSPSAVCSS